MSEPIDKCQADIEEHSRRFGPSPLLAAFPVWRLLQLNEQLRRVREEVCENMRRNVEIFRKIVEGQQ